MPRSTPPPYTREQADQLARVLTSLTPRQWTAKDWSEYYQSDEGSRWNEGDWYLTSPGDVTIVLDYSRGRYEIRCTQPNSLMTRYRSNPPGKITATASKTPRQIANDIKRRVYADYEFYLDKLEQESYKDRAEKMTRDSIQAALIAAGLHEYGSHGQTETSGKLYLDGKTSVRVEYDVYNDKQSYRLKIDAGDLSSVLSLLQAIN